MSYVDELEPLIKLEQELRQTIALKLAEERGERPADVPTEEQVHAADEAIAAWVEQVDFEQDMRAFRPQTPLQKLLAEYLGICERIFDIRDRRLS